MVREIVTYGDPVLREKCHPVEAITAEIRALAQDMVETMHAAHGVGLAAPQIGIAIQMAVIDIGPDFEAGSTLTVDGRDVALADWMPLVFFNPTLRLGRDILLDSEGCLSLPDIRAKVPRPDSVEASVTLLNGQRVVLTATGLLSRALQHETDHLNGILFTDRLPSASKPKAQRALKRLASEPGPHRYLPGRRPDDPDQADG